MKIAILGTSGSGKSTLAKRLGETYGLPVLHMDTVHFLPGWVERPFEEEETIIRRFLDENAGGWVIDGNYTKTCYARRLEEADQVIVLWFSPLVCLWRAVCRLRQNRWRGVRARLRGVKFSFACQKRTRKAPATFEAREARERGCSPLSDPKGVVEAQKC